MSMQLRIVHSTVFEYDGNRHGVVQPCANDPAYLSRTRS